MARLAVIEYGDGLRRVVPFMKRHTEAQRLNGVVGRTFEPEEVSMLDVVLDELKPWCSATGGALRNLAGHVAQLAEADDLLELDCVSQLRQSQHRVQCSDVVSCARCVTRAANRARIRMGLRASFEGVGL